MTNLRFGFDISESIQISLDLLNIFDSDDHDMSTSTNLNCWENSSLLLIIIIMCSNPEPLGFPLTIDFDFNNEFI